MRDEASFTAATMALQRAFESHRPAASRLFSDPYADAFLHGRLRAAAVASRFPVLRELATRTYDRIGGPGARPSAIARTRHIDDCVESSPEAAQQLVILGAGYDCRAHRLRGLAGSHVFEVDHPATQRTKQAAMDRTRLPVAPVVYVPVDFEHDALDERLLGAGFDQGTPAAFLWEGVTNYLTGAAVDRTLTTVHALARAGGTLLFTYVHVGVINGSVYFPEADRWTRAVARSGEPWTFGLQPDQLPEFLAARGYELQSECSTQELGDRWFPALGRRERGSALYRVALARIA